MNVLLDSMLPAPAHIADVTPRTDADAALFGELADVLKRHNALDRFGITLLHRHFDISAGEVLLETTDVATRVQTIQPVRDEEISGQPFIETAWRLGDGRVAMSCKCIKDGRDHDHLPRP